MQAHGASQFPLETIPSSIDVLKEMNCRVYDRYVYDSVALHDSYDSLCCGDKVVDVMNFDDNVDVGKILDESIIVADVVVDNVTCEIVDKVTIVSDIRVDIGELSTASTCDIIVDENVETCTEEVVPPKLSDINAQNC